MCNCNTPPENSCVTPVVQCTTPQTSATSVIYKFECDSVSSLEALEITKGMNIELILEKLGQKILDQEFIQTPVISSNSSLNTMEKVVNYLVNKINYLEIKCEEYSERITELEENQNNIYTLEDPNGIGVDPGTPVEEILQILINNTNALQ